MFDFEILKDFTNQMMWYNLCEYIQNKTTKYPQESLKAISEFVLPNFQRIHAITVCDTIMPVSHILEPQQSLDLVTLALQKLDEMRIQSQKSEIIRRRYAIKQHECRIYLKSPIETEKFIFECNKNLLNLDYLVYFYRLCYRFYEGISNYEECFYYLDKYLSCYEINKKDSYTDSQELLAFKFVKYSLLSRRVYNFIGIFLNPIYSKLSDKNLKIIFEMIKDGNFVFISKNKEGVEQAFSGKYAIIEEKAFLVALSNLCFINRNKDIKISEITDKLKISRNTALNFIVRAMGLQLIKGKIDGKDDILKLEYVKPRILSNLEIRDLMIELEKWRGKVKSTIAMLS